MGVYISILLKKGNRIMKLEDLGLEVNYFCATYFRLVPLSPFGGIPFSYS